MTDNFLDFVAKSQNSTTLEFEVVTSLLCLRSMVYLHTVSKYLNYTYLF